MPTVAAFHQANEAEKPGPKRMHHTGGFRRCVDCSRQDEIDALRSAAASVMRQPGVSTR